MVVLLTSGLALAAGCGNTVTEGTGGGGHGGSGGGSGGSGGAAECMGFGDETGAGAVTFHIKNHTPQAVYIHGNCGSAPYYSLTQVGAGEDAAVWVYDTPCLQTCADLQAAGEVPAPCDVCAPSVFRLDPGQTIDVTWDGTGVRPGYAMPEACYGFPGGPSSCSRIVAAPAGTWSAMISGYADCNSETCVCDPDGTCWGEPSGLMAFANPVNFNYPAETSIDLVFDSCAFGCP